MKQLLLLSFLSLPFFTAHSMDREDAVREFCSYLHELNTNLTESPCASDDNPYLAAYRDDDDNNSNMSLGDSDSTTSFGMNDDTKQSTRRFSIGDYFYIGDYTEYLLNCLAAESWQREHPSKKLGDYTEYLLNCLTAESWQREHPSKKHRKSDFHQYDEQLRRRSEPTSFYSKNRRQDVRKLLLLIV